MPRRSRGEIARAVRRLRGEALEPVAGLAPFLGAPAATARRWVISGYDGVYLDGLHRPGVGWLSSLPAAVRFARELAEREMEAADLAARGTAPADVSAGTLTAPPVTPGAVRFRRRA